MIIALTPEYVVDQELKTVVRLLDEGLDLLHIRRYQWTAKETAAYLRSIPAQYHPKLVLHAQHQLAEEFAIQNLHYSERDRMNKEAIVLNENSTYSTSVHDISAFDQLEKIWHYAFLSPFFPSISKPGYGESSTLSRQLSERTNTAVKLIALGGVDATTIKQLPLSNVDGVALLGAIWQSKDPIQAFRDCRIAFANRNL